MICLLLHKYIQHMHEIKEQKVIHKEAEKLPYTKNRKLCIIYMKH